MLRELLHVKQSTPGQRRRCFVCDDFNLTTWETECGSVGRFRITYHSLSSRWALFWSEIAGFEHFAVDDGEVSGCFHKSTPQLMHAPEPDLTFLADSLARSLATSNQSHPPAESALAVFGSFA